MEAAFQQLDNLTDINSASEYVGYLWFDNESKPMEINGAYDFTTVKQLPFIIEGNLKAKDKSHSISIRFVDGMYIIGKVDWDEFAKQEIAYEDHCYIAHGFSEAKSLCFKEAWMPVPDAYLEPENDSEIKYLCEKLPTLEPAWIAFTGFGQTSEDETND